MKFDVRSKLYALPYNCCWTMPPEGNAPVNRKLIPERAVAPPSVLSSAPQRLTAPEAIAQLSDQWQATEQRQLGSDTFTAYSRVS